MVLEMRKVLVATLFALAMAGGASADDVDVHVDNFYVEMGISTVVLKITNNSASIVPNVFVSCVFMDKDQHAIDVGKAWVTNLRPKQVAYDKASIPSSAGVQFASCTVD